MFKRIAAAALSLGFALSALASCSADKGDKVMEVGDLSLESVDISAEDGARVFTLGDNYISEALYDYLYVYFKEAVLAQAAYYKAYGTSMTVDPNIEVADTEEFWNAEVDDPGNEEISVMKDYVCKNTYNVAKDMLATEKAASDYGFVYPDGYGENLEAAIYEDVAANGTEYLEDVSEIADDSGTVFPWVKARRRVYLAGRGITEEDWERVFYLYHTVFAENITDHLASIGVIKAAPDEEIEKEAREYLESQIESFLNDNAKVDILYYQFKDASESSESADSSDTSDDVSSEDASPEEYNRRLEESCGELVEKLKDDPDAFKEASEDADAADEDAIVTKESLEEVLGKGASGYKSGDVKLFKVDGGIYVITYKELKEEDFGRTAVPTEEELKQYREQSLSKALNELLMKYYDVVAVDEKVIEKYDRPWEIK